jgi:Mrp family chromosome partitioning ATPase
MGKVYEALTRAETLSNGPRHSAVETDDPRDVEEVDEVIEPEVESFEEFNFLRYSLGSGAGMGRSSARAASGLVRRSKVSPEREVDIDLNRIDPHLVTFFNSDRGACEQYNKLALTLVSKAAERGFRRVLVASAEHGDGRTTVALNLACALARARQRVLVVDCDLENPSVARALGIDCRLGLHESFSDGLAPGAAAIRVRPFEFNILPARHPIDNPVEVLAAPAFWKMLKAFDADHDFILFDSPPLLAPGDPSLLVRFTDTTLLVIGAGSTGSSQLSKAIAPFNQDDILGVVLNRGQHV